MQSVARKLELGGAFQEAGRVVRSDASGVRVRTATGDHDARRAVSCLVEPILGDDVLLAILPSGATYVLAVLERSERATTTLRVDGDLEVHANGGRFAVAAQDGIDLVTGKDVVVTGAGVRVNAAHGSVVLEQLSFLGGIVRAELEKLKLFAGTLDSVLERVSLKAKRSYRDIEEIDRLRAGQVDYSAKSTMSLHGENALVTAEELVKVDGEQIHLG